MFFAIRHGERADFSYNKLEKKRITLECDPPLTSIGLSQAEKTGFHLNSLTKTFDSKKKIPIIISSPFLRCVETAMGIASKFDEIHENTIFLEDGLGEYLHRTWFLTNPLPELLIRDKEFIKNKDWKFNIKDGFLHKNDREKLIKPEYPEDFMVFFKRIQNIMSRIAFRFFEGFNPENYNVIIILHGYGVQVMLKNYSALQQFMVAEYCSITLLKYQDFKEYEILLKASDSHLKNEKPKL